jgi:hypothetical protein
VVAFETGKSPGGFPIYGFSIVTITTSDANGRFHLCAATAPYPSVVVVTALGTGGNAYPALVAPVSGSINFGDLSMGACRGTCFNGQQQTSAPATIDGAIGTTPIAKSGSLVPQYAMNAPNNSSELWELDVPLADKSQGNLFQTGAGNCAGGVPFCASYTLTLPSQNPVVRMAQEYLQLSGDPNYAIYTTLAGGSCIPPFGFTPVQKDGRFLTGAPGVSLTAADIMFQSCQ